MVFNGSKTTHCFNYDAEANGLSAVYTYRVRGVHVTALELANVISMRVVFELAEVGDAICKEIPKA